MKGKEKENDDLEKARYEKLKGEEYSIITDNDSSKKCPEHY